MKRFMLKFHSASLTFSFLRELPGRDGFHPVLNLTGQSEAGNQGPGGTGPCRSGIQRRVGIALPTALAGMEAAARKVPRLFPLVVSLILMMVGAAQVEATATVPPPSIKELTVFKDGHAFVVHEGTLPVGEGDRVVLDYLPAPVIGTFWTYSPDPDISVRTVTAGERLVRTERTALTLRELIEANPGMEVVITEMDRERYPATLIGLPTRPAEESARMAPDRPDGATPLRSDLVLVQTADGVRAVALDRIRDVTFRQPPRSVHGQDAFRPTLTLQLDGAGVQAGGEARVGLMYLQKGVRWIPGYRVDLDGTGRARITLQATVLNELADFEEATVHLVIGVPTFQFKETPDPIGLQRTAMQLSRFFQTDPRGGSPSSLLAANFSNTLMTQVARMGEYRTGVDVPATVGEGVAWPESGPSEDLYIFTVRNLTLRKGDRMVFTVSEVTVPYENVFSLELPVAPPPELHRHLNPQQQGELARLFAAPRVMHKVRLANRGQAPFTTAPVLLFRDGRVLAQGLMTYTAPGASVDLTLTAAVDIQVNKSDAETNRIPNAFHHAGNSFFRVDLAGTLTLINHRQVPIQIEVTRHVLGHVDAIDADGRIEMTNVFESRDHLPSGDLGLGVPWWTWSTWPWWWRQVNGLGRITWTLELAPQDMVALNYAWHYYWH